MLAVDIIKRPIITEKSSIGIENGKYTFEVNKKANKHQIKDAIEELFNVKVLNVNTMNFEGKTRRVKGKITKASNWKKAIIQIDINPKDKKKYKSEIEGFIGA